MGEFDDNLVEEYLAGASQVELHKKYGHGRPYICKVLKSRGVLRGLPSDDKVSELYGTGLTQAQVGADLGVSREYVGRVLKRLGVPLHPPKRVHTVNEKFFNFVDSEEKAYWWGFLLADGCVHGPYVTLRLAKGDRVHLQKFLDSLSATNPIKECDPSPSGFFGSTGSAVVSIGSRKIVSDLERLGVCPRKSLVATVDRGRIPTELERHFWRGVLDGDGTLYWDKHGSRPRITLAGAYGVCSGFASWVGEHTRSVPTVRPYKKIYTVGVSSRDSYNVVSSLLFQGASVYLDRKMQRYVEYRKRQGGALG